MPIQLDKILADVGKEKVLHPNITGATKKDIDDAWVRVGESNKLSVHEARSIFKVLQKKYEQEKKKDNSSWKLYAAMHEIYQTTDAKSDGGKQDPADMSVEDDEEYEMLDVQEEEDHGAHVASTASSDNESAKSQHTSPEKVARTPIATAPKRPTDEKKLLNTMASASPRPPLSSNAAQHGTSANAAIALQKKGITMKKTTTTTPASGTSAAAVVKAAPIATTVAAGKPSPNNTPASKPGYVKIMRNEIPKKLPDKKIQLPESIKRKLTEEEPLTSAKKPHISSQTILPAKPPTSTPAATHTTTNQLMQVKQELQVKQEIEDLPSSTAPPHGINVITIPASSTRSELTNGLVTCSGGGTSSTAATVASTSTNGDFSPRIEDFDFKTGIIFDPNASTTNGASSAKLNSTGEIINLGNFDNSLPQTFFRNLCTSSRHEALGLYVANVMNRLPARLASKLELSILRSIFDTRTEELEQ